MIYLIYKIGTILKFLKTFNAQSSLCKRHNAQNSCKTQKYGKRFFLKMITENVFFQFCRFGILEVRVFS